MFSTERLLVSMPTIPDRAALLPRRTPSTSNAVPNAALPSEEPPERSERTFDVVRSGLTVFPPGSKAAMSDMLDIWRWSIASLERMWDVLIPSLGRCAVTTTSSSARELTDIFISSPSMSDFTSSCVEKSTYPRHVAFRMYVPVCTFSKVKFPSESLLAQR